MGESILKLTPGIEFEREDKRYVVGERYPNGCRREGSLEYWVMELGNNLFAKKGTLSNFSFRKMQEEGTCRITKTV